MRIFRRAFLAVGALMLCASLGRAQAPDTIYISANSGVPVFTHVVLQPGTKYVIQASGGISYWRNWLPPQSDSADADAGFVFHVPYINGIPNSIIDGVNQSIGQFQYLPCDGSTCSTVPPEFGCGTIINPHNANIANRQLVHLDGDYLEVDGQTFCPRNGGDKVRHTYWQGIMGTGSLMRFRFVDGDGDYTNNTGTIQITVTRLEPIMSISKTTLDFGKRRPNSTPSPKQWDTLQNIGSPFFPGCSNAGGVLNYTIDSITGDVATASNGQDGFIINLDNGVKVGVPFTVDQGSISTVQAQFNPRQRRPYKAYIWLTTNDPQVPHTKITLIAEGIQGLTKINPVDTLDFGDTPLNQPKRLPLMITNIGSDILHFTGIAPDSVDPVFTLPSIGSMDMPVNMTIQPMFTFSPKRLGMAYSRVLVLSDGYGEAQHLVVLKGRGVAALLIVQDTLDFGQLPVGDTSHKTLPLLNAGNIPFGVQFVRFTAGDSLDFDAEPRTHITIDPDSTLNWQMAFHPTVPGPRLAEAEIADDGGGKPHLVYVKGFGIRVHRISAGPDLNYGIVSLDTTATLTTFVRNTGNIPLKVDTAYLRSGANFTLAPPTLPLMNPKDSTYFTVTFAPTAEVQYDDTLVIVDDSAVVHTIAVTGRGKRFIGVMAVADTLDFGDVVTGDTATKYLPVLNVGNARLTLSAMGFTVPSTEFMALPNLPTRIDTAGIDSVQSLFMPLTVGPKTAEFEIRDSNAGKNDGIAHVRQVTFIGNAIPPIVAVIAVDSGYEAPVGATIDIPVRLRSDITKAQCGYFKIQVHFDGMLLMPLRVATTPLTQGYDLTMTENPQGTLTIEGTNANGGAALTGPGDLCTVTYEVLVSASKQTPLAVTSLKVGTGRNPRYVQTVDGSFTANGQCGSDVVPRGMATRLAPNSPNPFVKTTEINYIVGVPAHVTVAVYDALGRKVADLVDADKNVGAYTTTFDGSTLPKGLYFCRMNAGQYEATKSMLLMR